MNSYIEHQQAVLGCIFLEPSCLDSISLIVNSSDFDARHSKIYQACLDISSEGATPDYVTVAKKYKDSGYLAELINLLPSAANFKYYADGVKDFSNRLRIADILSSGIAKLKEGENPVPWIEEQLSSMRGNKEDVVSVKKVLSQAMKEIDAARSSENTLGYKTGICDLDKHGCFQDGSLVIIAARPAMGKSVLGAQLLLHGEPGLVFSYEMGNSQLCKRLLAAESKVNLKKIKNGDVGENEYPKLWKGAESLASKSIFFCEANGMSIQDLRAKARLMVRKHGIKKIVIDYIQLSYNENSQNREQEISSITRNLKLMAQELNVCVIALSQLNRGLEKRENKRPMMSDLRESGAIEQDADVIIFIYRDSVYNANANEREAELIIGKYRDGEIGYVPCIFIGEHQHFTSEYKS